MTIAVPDLPVTGTPIETAWGTDVRNSIAEIDPSGATEGDVLRVNAALDGYDFEALAIQKEGEQATEATTTSTSAVDLITVSSLSIAVGRTVLITGKVRKTSGAASQGCFGLKVNSTVVGEADSSGQPAVARTSSTDQAESGSFSIIIPPRTADYLYAAHAEHAGGPGWSSTVAQPTKTAALPNAEITSVTIRALCNGSGITIAAKDVQVWTLG